MNEQPAQMNIHSSRITQPKSQGASQAMLLATGLSHSDLNQPQVGIAACWYEGNPCNIHLDGLGSCLLYTSPSPRDATLSRMPSSA